MTESAYKSPGRVLVAVLPKQGKEPTDEMFAGFGVPLHGAYMATGVCAWHVLDRDHAQSWDRDHHREHEREAHIDLCRTVFADEAA